MEILSNQNKKGAKGMPEELLTIAEIAKRLGIAESNVRYYRDRFEEFIPYRGEGRNRRYLPETVEIIRTIAEGYANNLTASQIAEQLSRLYSINHKVSEREQQLATTKPQQIPAEVSNLLAELLSGIRETATAINRLADNQEEIRLLREEVAELRKQLEKQQKRSWFQKLLFK